MSRNIDDLCPTLAELCKEHIHRFNIASDFGITLLVYCTYRSLEEQAILYRKSRTYSEITKKILIIRGMGYSELGNIIEDVGPRGTKKDLGKHVTFAAPGESYHNYGLAYDAVPLCNGKPLWIDWNDDLPGHNEYKLYGQIATQLGIEWAGGWTNFKEFPHCQLGKGKNPLKFFDKKDIERLLEV